MGAMYYYVLSTPLHNGKAIKIKKANRKPVPVSIAKGKELICVPIQCNNVKIHNTSK
jgi:hypothetical protein